MNKIYAGMLFSIAIISPGISLADQYDKINAEVAAIAKDIKENGPPELRQLPYSVIADTARTFVTGREFGTISPASMSRMGGARGATESSLRGQLKGLGGF